MEELQSTEILDREILEDARKKALRILKTCEETIKTQNADWEKKTAKNIDELNIKYEKLSKTESERVMARLPIDKLRVKIERIENMLSEAVDEWYKGMDRSSVLKILSVELKKRLSQCIEFNLSNQIAANISGLTQEEAKKILKENNLNLSFVTCNFSQHAARFPSIMLESSLAKITASIETTIESILLERRIELTEALTGREFLEGM
ncbi:MAG: hypothetical protein FWB83_03425 [Treponema sp.]|nr:hypothetical protein [Treponema sp.]